MKWLCTLLALLILTLSVQPVCAAGEATQGCCAAVSCAESGDCTDEDCDREKECSNSCNPFQLCSCCAFSIVTPQTFFLLPATTATSATNAWYNYSCTVIDAPFAGIWQPPRA